MQLESSIRQIIAYAVVIAYAIAIAYAIVITYATVTVLEHCSL